MLASQNEGGKAPNCLQFDFNGMMADYVAEARAAVRSELRRLAHGLEGPEREKLGEAVAVLSDPPGRLLRRNFIEQKEIKALEGQLSAAHEAVRLHRGDEKRMMTWTELPYSQGGILGEIKEYAAIVRENFEAFVVFGIGGSALGPAMVHGAMSDLRHNELPKEKRGGAPKFYVEDNIDPERMVSLLNVLDLEKTCFNVISKSGNTSETMSQLLIVIDLLKQRLGEGRYESNLVFTTDANEGNLLKIAEIDGFKTFVVPDGVGGRFSELCPVGLLPAAVLGIDIEELLEGAKDMDERCKNPDYAHNPALFAAGAMFLAAQKGENVHVMMPYADSLRLMADWYAQLWAESLGKNQKRGGERVLTGQTPTKALGVTDQHSQVQLYAEGPEDKVVTFLKLRSFRKKITIPRGCEAFVDVAFLCGRTLNELLEAECEATEYALLKAAKPSWSVTLPEVSAHTIGQLIYFFELMTAYSGELYDIDAFNQPGVEEGKNASYAIFGREGYEIKRLEIAAQPRRDEQYIL
ncbi:MAG: glucose-6-phosphate isomerase [Christensenellaceae bacterium]|jgi:glucose-6-phosphate isomerase|nr:glucose-6-phosphate isomerase [Christensenellaceae bacterium]